MRVLAFALVLLVSAAQAEYCVDQNGRSYRINSIGEQKRSNRATIQLCQVEKRGSSYTGVECDIIENGKVSHNNAMYQHGYAPFTVYSPDDDSNTSNTLIHQDGQIYMRVDWKHDLDFQVFPTIYCKAPIRPSNWTKPPMWEKGRKGS